MTTRKAGSRQVEKGRKPTIPTGPRPQTATPEAGEEEEVSSPAVEVNRDADRTETPPKAAKKADFHNPHNSLP